NPAAFHRPKVELDRRDVVENQLEQILEIVHRTVQPIGVRTEPLARHARHVVDALKEIPKRVLGLTQHGGTERDQVLPFPLFKVYWKTGCLHRFLSSKRSAPGAEAKLSASSVPRQFTTYEAGNQRSDTQTRT